MPIDPEGGQTYNETMNGGTVLNGDSLLGYLFNEIVSGGVILNGTAEFGYLYDETVFGGILVGGSLDFTSVFEIEISGGISLTGSSIIDVIYQLEVTANGCLLSGQSPSDHSLIMSGGSVVGATASIETQYNVLSIGGTALSGQSQPFALYTIIDSSGGASASGISVVRVIILMQGGTTVSGDASLTFAFIPSGGSIAGGLPDVTSSVNEPPNGISQGGIKALGVAANSQERIIAPYFANGQVLINGSASYGIKDITFTASGGISLEESEPVRANLKFASDLTFKWRLNSFVIKDTTFLWNLGQLTMYWYRVVGKGTTDPCLPQDPCCQKFILNVHARSLAELCQKLSKRRYKFPIDFVQKFSRPTDNDVVAAEEANGINHDCNNLIDIDVCNIPECADFCVDQDIVEHVGFSITLQVNAFKEHEASGVVSISGFASAAFTKNLPEYQFTSSGNISISAEAEAYPNHFRMRGGSTLSGSADSACSRWSFTGGVWPFQTTTIFANVTESVSQTSSEQVWALPERIKSDNGLYSSTDISYSKISQGLVARNFGLNLPSWSNVLQVVITVDRKASSTSIRDYEIYLVLGDEQLSENLAITGISWPLIETPRYYAINAGTHGWRNAKFESLVPPQTIWQVDDLNVEDLNSPEFGVFLKVKNHSNVTAIARVDYINIQVTYEDPNGSIVRVSSDGARAVGPTYFAESIGGPYLTGQANFSKKKRYIQRVTAAGARIGGQAPFLEEVVSSGGASLGGEALTIPYIEQPSGGCVLSATEALVNPAWYTMAGGLQVHGAILTNTIYEVEVMGGMLLSGQSIVTADQFFYTASGGIAITGAGRARTPNRNFISDGNILFAQGEADYVAGDFALDNEHVGFDMTVSNITATFLTDIELNNLTGVTDTLSKCGCFNLPLTIQLYHNFARDNSFAKFLVRNGLTIRRTLSLNYNEINDSWQNNLHYKGLSFDKNSYETWDVISELNCTDTVGSVLIGRPVWKLAIQFFKKNLTTGSIYDSRIILAVLPDNICRGSIGELDFSINYDTESGLATVSPNATLYQSTVYDNIGLFRNPSWVDNPVLQIKVSQTSTTRLQPRLDLTSTILT